MSDMYKTMEDGIPNCPECGIKLKGVEEHYGVIDCPDKKCKGRIKCYSGTMRIMSIKDGVAYMFGSYMFQNSTYNSTKFGT